MATIEDPVRGRAEHFLPLRVLSRTNDERSAHHRKIYFLPDF